MNLNIEYGDGLMYGGANPDKPEFESIAVRPGAAAQLGERIATEGTKVPGGRLGNDEAQLRKRKFQPGTVLDENQLDSLRQTGGRITEQGFKSMTVPEVDSLRKRYGPERGRQGELTWLRDSSARAASIQENIAVFKEGFEELRPAAPTSQPLPSSMMAPEQKGR